MTRCLRTSTKRSAGFYNNLNAPFLPMKKKNVNRIPVVNKAGKLVGIIARADLVNYLAEKED